MLQGKKDGSYICKRCGHYISARILWAGLCRSKETLHVHIGEAPCTRALFETTDVWGSWKFTNSARAQTLQQKSQRREACARETFQDERTELMEMSSTSQAFFRITCCHFSWTYRPSKTCQRLKKHPEHQSSHLKHYSSQEYLANPLQKYCIALACQTQEPSLLFWAAQGQRGTEGSAARLTLLPNLLMEQSTPRGIGEHIYHNLQQGAEGHRAVSCVYMFMQRARKEEAEHRQQFAKTARWARLERLSHVAAAAAVAVGAAATQLLKKFCRT
eukprot:1145511-Pelagomonas_calceolata.AAC.7